MQNSSNAQAVANVEKTLTQSFFNGCQWPVYIEISECNVKFELRPGETVVDTQRHPINDPILDQFVKPQGLSKSVGKVPIPINYMPRKVLPTSNGQHAVTEAVRFQHDAFGRLQPVYAPAKKQVAAPPISTTSHVGMSVEEAKRRGLIGAQRIVPEDYGHDDVAGTPLDHRKMAGIKYSMEQPGKLSAPPSSQFQTALTEEVTRATSQGELKSAVAFTRLSAVKPSSNPEVFQPGAVNAPVQESGITGIGGAVLPEPDLEPDNSNSEQPNPSGFFSGIAKKVFGKPAPRQPVQPGVQQVVVPVQPAIAEVAVPSVGGAILEPAPQIPSTKRGRGRPRKISLPVEDQPPVAISAASAETPGESSDFRDSTGEVVG